MYVLIKRESGDVDTKLFNLLEDAYAAMKEEWKEMVEKAGFSIKLANNFGDVHVYDGDEDLTDDSICYIEPWKARFGRYYSTECVVWNIEVKEVK